MGIRVACHSAGSRQKRTGFSGDNEETHYYRAYRPFCSVARICHEPDFKTYEKRHSSYDSGMFPAPAFEAQEAASDFSRSKLPAELALPADAINGIAKPVTECDYHNLGLGLQLTQARVSRRMLGLNLTIASNSRTDRRAPSTILPSSS